MKKHPPQINIPKPLPRLTKTFLQPLDTEEDLDIIDDALALGAISYDDLTDLIL